MIIIIQAKKELLKKKEMLLMKFILSMKMLIYLKCQHLQQLIQHNLDQILINNKGQLFGKKNLLK